MVVIRDALKEDLKYVNTILEINGQLGDKEEEDFKGFIVAEEDGQVVGCGMLRDHNYYVEIRKVSVLPEFQNRGIGKKIAHKLLDRAKDKKCLLLSVGVHSFWEQFGFYIIPGKEEPREIKEQCECCSQKQVCNRVVMLREEV